MSKDMRHHKSRTNLNMKIIKETLENTDTVNDLIQVLIKYRGVVTSKYCFKKGKRHLVDGQIVFRYGESSNDECGFGPITYRSKGSLFAPSYYCGIAADSYKLSEKTIRLINEIF